MKMLPIINHQFSTMVNDVRFGLRMLRKNPGFAAIAIVTLALGVAGNIVIFSVFNAFYLRPFPFAEPNRLVDLDETAPRWNLEYTGLAYPDFCAWREHNRSFQGMAAWKDTPYNVSFEGSSERVQGTRVTHDLASVLGIKPILGRPFTPEEDRPGGARVALLGNGFWKRHFGSREDIVGRTVRLNHEPYTIVGVLPPDKGVLVEGEFWVPLAENPDPSSGSWHLRGVGRLKEGVTLSMAREDLCRVHQGLVDNRRANENTSPRLTQLSERFFGPARLMVQALLGAVGVVLLIATLTVHVGAAFVRFPLRHLLQHRAAHGRWRHLRRVFVCGEPAHTGDRSAPGAGRAATRRDVARRAPGSGFSGDGNRHRIAGGGDGCSADEPPAFWSQPIRSFYVRWDCALVDCGFLARLLGSDSARRKGGSDDRTQMRMKTFQAIFMKHPELFVCICKDAESSRCALMLSAGNDNPSML
jgi:hypothetical protein